MNIDKSHFRKTEMPTAVWAALGFMVLATILGSLRFVLIGQYWNTFPLWGMTLGGIFVLREYLIQAFRRRVTWGKPYLMVMYEVPYPRKCYVWRSTKRIKQITRLMERRVMKSDYVVFAEVVRERATIWFHSDGAMIAFRLAYCDDKYIDFDVPDDILI